MTKLYFRKIKAEEMKIEDVPERWRTEVQELLNESH